MAKSTIHWSKILKQHVIQVEKENDNLKQELVLRNEKLKFVEDQLAELEKVIINKDNNRILP
jgi:hypothetical protein